MSRRPRCRCGVWVDCHHRVKDHDPRPASRIRLWFVDHELRRHVAGWLWMHVPEKQRWKVVGWYFDRHPELCWCELVDAALKPSDRADYRGEWGCPCHVPLPTDAGLPRPDWCYCPPQGAVA